MNWQGIGFSSLAVLAVLTLSGTIISLLSTQLQCSKIGFTTSLEQGLVNAVFPSVVYALAVSIERIRSPFASTIQYFGVDADSSSVVGVGYLVMLASWITVVWNVNRSEKAVCKPSTSEMTEFKTKLLAELQQKEVQADKDTQKVTIKKNT